MVTNASSGSPAVNPQLYRTLSISTILQAEKQDRFLQLGELNQLTTFLNSGSKRLDIASVIAQNANLIVAKAADRIFVGGSSISYLERPQAAVTISEEEQNQSKQTKELTGNVQVNLLDNLKSLFSSGESAPTGFKPINVVRYGPNRMKKSLRDLDWFLRYLTYAIVAGDPNILSVNIQGLRELIENACSSAATLVALKEMKRTALSIFVEDAESREIVNNYFNVILSGFTSPGLTDQLRKRASLDVQGLRLPRVYSQAGVPVQKFAMKPGLSAVEKVDVIKACYRQVFERDISKAYSLSISNLESQLKIGQISTKEFIRALGKSELYRKEFYEPFVNSRVVELGCRHFLGRGLSSLEEFQKYFSILSTKGLSGLVDSFINSNEYSDYFGEETVPYLRGFGVEAQECRNWGVQIKLFNYSAPFKKTPQFITLFSDYKDTLPDQHPYGKGNDPLEIQFGAIFPSNTKNSYSRPAPFGKDSRRILVRKGPGIYNQLSNPAARATTTGLSGIKIFDSSSKDISKSSVLKAVYLRVFGRLIYEKEKASFAALEDKFLSGNISVKELIRQLSKSDIFRSLYWNPLYICKAIEYIHNRLLGRPTYGRREINKYFNIAYKEGYYKVIDSIIDSREYSEVFNDKIVPYERYNTPAGVSLRSLRLSTIDQKFAKLPSSDSAKFLSLGKAKELVGDSIFDKIKQGVTSRRDQKVVFKLNNTQDSKNINQVLQATYRQLFERDINTFSIGNELIKIEKEFKQGNLSVKELVAQLGCSELYSKEFYQPYPNTKVIELGTKHFLGRAPNNQAEIRYYNQILASKGIKSFIETLVNSKEYNSIFAENSVPYRRFPTLPAANFPNTEKLFDQLTKQNPDIVVPSFKAITRS